MNLTDSLRSECIQIGSPVRNKDGVLRQIANLAIKSPILSNYREEQVYQALKEREEIGSTAFGKGIAIPHCGLEQIDEFVVGLLSVPEGVAFDSYDEAPTRLLTFIIGPLNKRNEHVNLLSAISKILDNEAAVDELLSARRPNVLEESFLRHHAGHIPGETRERCLFQVTLQDEELFDDILRVFSSAVEGDITVLEGNNAGAYLNRLPMFSAFWSQESTGFCRVIVAVVDKAMCNDMVRRINLEVDDLDSRSGILITVQELMLVRGSLDF